MKKLTFLAFLVFILFFNCSKDDSKDDINTPVIVDDNPRGDNPGDNFDLTTLYIETSWNTPDRSTISELASTFNAIDFFFMENHSMVLISKESDGKRTELKEPRGEEKSLNAYKKLDYTAKVDFIPENGVTIAQVHNRGNGVIRPLVRVYIDNDRKIKFRLSDDPEGDSTFITIIGPDYEEGSVFSVMVLIEKGEAEFSIETTSGSKKHTFRPSNNWQQYSTSYYSKSGVYTEGDDTKPKISFSAFSLLK